MEEWKGKNRIRTVRKETIPVIQRKMRVFKSMEVAGMRHGTDNLLIHLTGNPGKSQG